MTAHRHPPARPSPPGWQCLGRMRRADVPPLPESLPLAFTADNTDDGLMRVHAAPVWHDPVQRLLSEMATLREAVSERAPTTTRRPCLLSAVLVEVGRLQRLGLGARGLRVLMESGGWAPCPA